MIEQLQADLDEAQRRSMKAEVEQQRLNGTVQILTLQLEAQKKLEQSVRQREMMIKEKEVSLAAREAAHEVAAGAMEYFQNYHQEQPFSSASSVVSQGGASMSVSHTVHRSQVDFHRRLCEIESDLYKRCLLLQQGFQTLNERSKEVERAEAICHDRLEKLSYMEKEAMERLNQREIEIGAKLATIKPELAQLHTETKRLEAKEIEVNAKLADIQKREAAITQAKADVAQREAAVKAQHHMNETEREVCKKLSEDVVRREGAVRAVEKSMNVARAELQRLEDDVASRVRKLLDDEAAVKRWAADTEKKEQHINNILHQLKDKGVHLASN